MNYNVDKAISDLNGISENLPHYSRMIEVSGVITKLMDESVKFEDLPIIVGGFSLEIYTNSEYTTQDIDFVTSASLLMGEKLLEIGFVKSGRMYLHERINVAVDIVDSELDPPDYKGLIRIDAGKGKYVLVQSIENILIDRALDYESLDNREYAIYLISTRYDQIDFEKIRDSLESYDDKALVAFNQWLEVAIETLDEFNH